jgi:hypothetical protein
MKTDSELVDKAPKTVHLSKWGKVSLRGNLSRCSLYNMPTKPLADLNAVQNEIPSSAAVKRIQSVYPGDSYFPELFQQTAYPVVGYIRTFI